MASDVHGTTVGDYVTLVRGTTYKGQLVGEPGPALLGLGSIEPGGGFRIGHYKTYGGDCPAELMLFPGDIYASLKGATKDGKMIGSVARVPPSVPTGRLTQDTVKLVFRNPNPEDASYLHWVLRTPQYREYCAGHATGSAVVALSRRDFLAYPVPPPTKERRTAVALLDAIEERIELNRRMNETLEAMARALFKSWFVDFDPVRAKAERRDPGLPKPLADLFPDSFEDSELGEIPKGWLLRTIEELSERVAMGPFGSSIKVETFVSQGIPVISGQHLRGTMLDDSDFNFITHEHADQLQRCNVQRGDVVFTHAGSIGQVAFIPGTSRYDRYVISQRQFYLRCDPKKMSAMFIVLYFKTPEGQHRLLANTSSTGVPSISQPVSYLRQLKIVVPPKILLQTFDSVARSIYLRVAANTKESRTLAALRDTLLPKLISGEVHVGEIAKAAIA
jgi:type I restriction enzyme S subunit